MPYNGGYMPQDMGMRRGHGLCNHLGTSVPDLPHTLLSRLGVRPLIACLTVGIISCNRDCIIRKMPCPIMGGTSPGTWAWGKVMVSTTTWFSQIGPCVCHPRGMELVCSLYQTLPMGPCNQDSTQSLASSLYEALFPESSYCALILPAACT